MNPDKLIKEDYSEIGIFWLPDCKVREVVGMLSVGVRGDIKLRTYHDLSCRNNIRTTFNNKSTVIDVIHGRMHSNMMVVLFDCCFYGNILHAKKMIRGNKLTQHSKINDYSFKSASIIYNNTADWLGYVFVSDRTEQVSNEINLKLRNIPSYTINGCELKLNYRWNHNIKKAELTTKDIFTFKFNNDVNIGKIIDYTSIFGDFLLLLMNVPISPEYICLQEDESNNDIQLVHQRRNIFDVKKAKFSEIISYWDIENDFQNILLKWFNYSLNSEINDALRIYTESYISQTAMEIAFLILFQACEGIAKRVEPDKFKKEKVKCILINLLKTYTKPMISILTDTCIEALADKMNKTRNYWIHNSGNIKKGDTFIEFDFDAITCLLSYTLRSYLLHQIGMSQDIIKNHLSPHQVFGSTLLNDLEVQCNKILATNDAT